MPSLIRHLDRRTLLVGAAVLAVLALLPLLVRDKVTQAVEEVAAADGRWLALAVASFLLVIVATARAWCAGIRALGGEIGSVTASARYAVGSLVNGVAPSGTGGAVRIALFSRALPEGDRVLTATGIAAAIGVARAPAMAALVLAAAALGAFPLWPVLVLGAALAVGVGVAWWSRRWTPHARVAHVLDAFRALAQCPRAALAMVGCITTATFARVLGALAIAASLGVTNPVEAGLVMIPALCLAAALPSTPGNVGVSSGAVVVALSLIGVGFQDALAVGLAFHAVETIVSIAAGSLGLLFVAKPQVRLPAAVRYAGTGTGIALLGVLAALV